MPTVFISYDHEDQTVVEQLERKLQQHGIDIWRDQNNVRAGDLWPETISQAIADCDVVLLVWSGHAEASHFVNFEWNQAIASRKHIVPCVLDRTPMPPAFQALHQIQTRNVDDAVAQILTALRIPVSTPVKPPRRWYVWAAVAVVVLVAAGLVTLRFATSKSNQVLSGTVVVAGSRNQPLAGVTVALPEFRKKKVTKANGRFAFRVKVAKQRQVELIAGKPGYQRLRLHPFLGDTSLEIEMRKAP